MSSTSWDYRVVRRVVDGEVVFGIHEGYYGLGEVGSTAWTADPVTIVADSVEGLRTELGHVVAALERPVIDGEAPS